MNFQKVHEFGRKEYEIGTEVIIFCIYLICWRMCRKLDVQLKHEAFALPSLKFTRFATKWWLTFSFF